MDIHTLSMRQFTALNDSLRARINQKTSFMHQVHSTYVRSFATVALLVSYPDEFSISCLHIDFHFVTVPITQLTAL
jgi:hypothetical protein